MTQTIYTLHEALAAWNQEVDRQEQILATNLRKHISYEKNTVTR